MCEEEKVAVSLVAIRVWPSPLPRPLTVLLHTSWKSSSSPFCHHRSQETSRRRRGIRTARKRDPVELLEVAPRATDSREAALTSPLLHRRHCRSFWSLGIALMSLKPPSELLLLRSSLGYCQSRLKLPLLWAGRKRSFVSRSYVAIETSERQKLPAERRKPPSTQSDGSGIKFSPETTMLCGGPRHLEREGGIPLLHSFFSIAVALSSILKILKFEVFDERTPGAREVMKVIVTVITDCRLEKTDDV
ncbi:hypothetical protein Ahy_A05g025351 [Arachis hypogaea]|uniref:Uncharacterized protein n=1 Tax=Arachis hypogaea TaxID=3818 RepID=A0A445D8G9_ARAHY|nr:hypothetical protein Ahy_A05g025351 [Arachis hypogaea]